MSCYGLHDVLADSGSNIITEVSQADRFECQGKFVLGNLSEKSTIADYSEARPIKWLCREQICRGASEDLNRQWRRAMIFRLSLLLMLFCFIAVRTASLAQADGEILGFAVVSEAPKDKARVSAKVSVNDAVSDMKLLASETILNNLIWKKLEICHAMRMEGYKVAEGFQIVTVHMIDAGMLPMSLQSFAGDCLIKKAIEIAPLVD